jgi:hypothetical protein
MSESYLGTKNRSPHGGINFSNLIIYTLLAATLAGTLYLLLWRNSFCRNSWVLQPFEWDTLSGIRCLEKDSIFESFLLPCGYMHIPVFSENFFALLHYCGIKTVPGLRLASIVINVASLALFFAAMSVLMNRFFGLLMVWAVLITAHFWMRSYGLYEYAFQLAHQSMLLLGLGIFSRFRSKWGIVLAFIGGFWQGSCHYVYQILTFFIVAGFLLTDKKKDQKWYFLVMLGGPAAFLFHYLQVALSMHSISDAFSRLLDIYLMRSAGMEGTAIPSILHIQHETYLWDTWNLLTIQIGYGDLLLPCTALTLIILALAAMNRRDTETRDRLVQFLFVCYGSIAWFLAMPQDVTHDQFGPIHHLTLLRALSITVPVYAFFILIKRTARSPLKIGIPALVVGVSAGLIWWANIGKLKDYWAFEKASISLYVSSTRDLHPYLFFVNQSKGLDASDWAGLFNPQLSDQTHFRRKACLENDEPACREPVQKIFFSYLNPVRQSEIIIYISCLKPGDTRISYFKNDTRPKLITRKIIRDFPGGVVDLPLSANVYSDDYMLEFGPEACEGYGIKHIKIN